MKKLEFNSEETFQLWYALRNAIRDAKSDLREWEALNKNGGFKSMIDETNERIETLEHLETFITYCDKIKIVGE